MPRQLHLEGPALEPLLEQARADHGADVTVLGAHRVRRGGFAGFFAREHYEVTLEVPDPTERRPAGSDAPAVTAVRAAGAETLEELLALADRADGAGALADARARAATAPVLARPGAALRLGAVRPARMPAHAGLPAAAATVTAGPPAAATVAATVAAGMSVADASPAVQPVRTPGRTLSTETRGFDEVLAALRADLLGPGSTDALDRRYESSVDRLDLPVLDRPTALAGTTGVVAAEALGAELAPGTAVGLGVPAARTATPWQPATVLEDEGTDGDADLDADLDADVDADLDRGLDADLGAATQAADRAHLTGELAGLALAVGAGRSLAAAAAADTASSGATDLRHLLPLLASALADRLPVLPAAGAPAPRAVPGQAHEGLRDSAPELGAAAGEVVVVLGAPDRVEAAAADVAAQLGTPWLARWSDEPGARRRPGGTTVLSETRALPALAGKARAAGLPLVLALPDPTLADGVGPVVAGSGRAALLPSLDPDLVVLVVDADASPRRQQGVTDRVVAAHGARRPLVLALVGCEAAASPLAHVSTPVALLDGRPATAGTWTGVLLDALRSSAAR